MIKDLLLSNLPALLPLLLVSIAGAAVVIERAGYFWKIRSRSGDSLSEALEKLGRLPAERVLASFHQDDCSPAKELLEFSLSRGISGMPQLYKQRLEAARDRHLDRMEKNLGLISGVANVSTLMGLFGTVAGMISAFARMNQTGNSDPYVLAGGISQALVTTAAGLAVAIPAMLALHLLENLAERHSDRMEQVIAESLLRAGVRYARQRERTTS